MYYSRLEVGAVLYINYGVCMLVGNRDILERRLNDADSVTVLSTSVIMTKRSLDFADAPR